MSQMLLGIDIGGTNTKLGLLNEAGEIFARCTMPTESDKPFTNFAKRLRTLVDGFCSENKFKIEDLKIGLGIPNYCVVTELLESPSNFSWGTFPIKSQLEECLGKSLFIDNDANVAALGEMIWGEAIGLKDFVVITVGTGIGSGVVAGGKVLHGASGLAGEAGHLVVRRDDPTRVCGCGGTGHFESYCSVPGLKRSAAEKVGRPIRYHECIERFQNGDAQVIDIFRSTAKDFAFGLSQIMVLLSPDRIILAGGGMVAGQPYLEMIRSELESIIYKPILKTIDLRVSKLSTVDGAVLGAAALCLQ